MRSLRKAGRASSGNAGEVASTVNPLGWVAARSEMMLALFSIISLLPCPCLLAFWCTDSGQLCSDQGDCHTNEDQLASLLPALAKEVQVLDDPRSERQGVASRVHEVMWNAEVPLCGCFLDVC